MYINELIETIPNISQNNLQNRNKLFFSSSKKQKKPQPKPCLSPSTPQSS